MSTPDEIEGRFTPAWQAHGRWIGDQAEQHLRGGCSGLGEGQVVALRAAAGESEAEAYADDEDRA
ncbi:hypothetical protein [Actinomadura sp. HBU206391]|uniref:hypothetical protein n=1 Tax=Actinomadura sp. HBU206391 TaxID=2731692 RepID=UPI00164F7219|nr:hypothetical protein [Actinomadura sp. HBU206391]MBC6459393.1 hypothetical protein [Actinomadura sp. HBU206391]